MIRRPNILLITTHDQGQWRLAVAEATTEERRGPHGGRCCRRQRSEVVRLGDRTPSLPASMSMSGKTVDSHRHMLYNVLGYRIASYIVE
jgi:hypothetical protein